MSSRPSEQTLLQANDAFYRSFEELDFSAMAQLWEKSERVYCVHPGWAPLRGHRAVLDSWKRIIENTEAMHFTLSDVKTAVEGALGIVTVFENVYSELEGQRLASGAAATNLFGWDGQGWKIFHHHAAPAPLAAVAGADWLN
ncbi:MAG: nuclear transport factor 2 family protein [bacterium]